MNSSSYVGAPLVLPVAWAVATVVTLVQIPWSYLIVRAVVLTYIYGICFATPARVAVVAPRWMSGLPML